MNTSRILNPLSHNWISLIHFWCPSGPCTHKHNKCSIFLKVASKKIELLLSLLFFKKADAHFDTYSIWGDRFLVTILFSSAPSFHLWKIQEISIRLRSQPCGKHMRTYTQTKRSVRGKEKFIYWNSKWPSTIRGRFILILKIWSHQVKWSWDMPFLPFYFIFHFLKFYWSRFTTLC